MEPKTDHFLLKLVIGVVLGNVLYRAGRNMFSTPDCPNERIIQDTISDSKGGVER